MLGDVTKPAMDVAGSAASNKRGEVHVTVNKCTGINSVFIKVS
jgi:hypothetical protein